MSGEKYCPKHQYIEPDCIACVTRYYQEAYEDVIGARDRLKSESQKWQLDCMKEFELRKKMMGERDRLKAELEDYKKHLNRATADLAYCVAVPVDDYDKLILWKQKAEKLAEALRDLLNHGTPITNPSTGEPEPYQSHPEHAAELLAAFEREGK